MSYRNLHAQSQCHAAFEFGIGRKWIYMTEILLIRHGETDWNVEKRLQGHLDISLNEGGRRQAAALGKALLGAPLDAVIASELQRAIVTAESDAVPRGMRAISMRVFRQVRVRPKPCVNFPGDRSMSSFVKQQKTTIKRLRSSPMAA